ncbi:MAG: site-2 protease family protein [Oscillospiraceae bacterium]|nr:site-2 protease family protein [Oscillospiraceae bacterium]
MLNFFDLKDIIISVFVTLIALSGHELAHAWVSHKLGDPTPENEGRLTLNPFAHLDPIGTLMMIITGFGWARPVGINPMYYKHRKAGMILVSIAGPLANFVMAFIGALIMVVLVILNVKLSVAVPEALIYPIERFIFLNISLMVFNLIPIPPLDGSKVLGMLLPENVYFRFLGYERYFIIVIMVLSVTGALSGILVRGVEIVFGVLINMVALMLSWL